MTMETTIDFGAKFNREQAIAQGYTPTGRKLGIAVVKGTSLYKVFYVDDKPGTREISEMGLDSMWTKPEFAEEAMRKYLTEFWNMSEAAAKKAERKQQSGAN